MAQLGSFGFRPRDRKSGGGRHHPLVGGGLFHAPGGQRAPDRVHLLPAQGDRGRGGGGRDHGRDSGGLERFPVAVARVSDRGHHLAGQQLQPVHTATTIRSRNGKVSTTDGPFAETKEQLGGYYLIEAKDLNEAIQVASRIPSVKTGSIEVRPIMTFS